MRATTVWQGRQALLALEDSTVFAERFDLFPRVRVLKDVLECATAL